MTGSYATYTVRTGDTIRDVTARLGITWRELLRSNPHAVGRTKKGRWFLKEGVVITYKKDFIKELDEALDRHEIKADIGGGHGGGHGGPPSIGEEWFEYVVQKGDTLWDIAVRKFRVDLKDIIRDNGIKNPDLIYPGQRLRIRRRVYPKEQAVVASWYGRPYHGRPMANGQPYNMYMHTIAHRYLPFGTKVEFYNPSTGEIARAVVTDRGPYVRGRDVDLSYALARRLSLLEKGVGRLIMRVIG